MKRGMSADRSNEGDFGALLSRHRRKAGMTQEQLADHARMAIRSIRNLERGTARPRRASVQLLADALRLEAAERSAFERAGAPRPGEDDRGEARTTRLWRPLSRKGATAISLFVAAVLIATGYWIWPVTPSGPGADSSPPPCLPGRSAPNQLFIGECLGVDSELVAQTTTLPSGGQHSYRLTLGNDFNLVLYERTDVGGSSTSRKVWETGTTSCGSAAGQHAGFAVLRSDGDFVLYSSENVIVWASDTTHRPFRALAIQSDGSLVLRSADGKVTSDSHRWHPGCRIGQCMEGYFCLYERAQFRGRRLQFRDCGTAHDLSQWGFASQASSWINKTNKPVDVYGEARFHLLGLQLGGSDRLWRAAPLSAASYVGSQNNDRARAFRLVC